MPLPPPDMQGRTWTNQFRLRPRWFFGVVLEQLVINADGESQWMKAQRPIRISVT